MEGADLCVRPGYPVNPDNSEKQLPAAAKRFADEGLSIPLVTTPTSFLDPKGTDVQRVYAACGEAGCCQSQGRLLALVEGGWWILGIGRSHPHSPRRISITFCETWRAHLPPQPFGHFDGVELIRRDEPRQGI